MVLKLRGEHSLGDFLNDTFLLVPRIWKNALLVSLVSLVPGAALWVAAIGRLARWVEGVAAETGTIEKDPSLLFSGLAPLFLLVTLASLALFAGKALQKAFVCAQAGAAIEGRSIGFGDLASAEMRRAWARVAAQDAIVGALAYFIALGIFGAIFLPFLLGKLGDIANMATSGGSGVGLVVSLLAVYFGSALLAGAAVWWLRVRTCVSAPSAVLERVNSFSGIGRSLDLARGRGWRIFGTMFIVSLVLSFALGIAVGPITFIAVIPGYLSFLKESLSGGKPSMESALALVSSMGWAMGVSMLLTGMVQGTLWPSFLALLHGDLRIRAGEKEPWVEASPASLPIEAASEDSIPGAIGDDESE